MMPIPAIAIFAPPPPLPPMLSPPQAPPSTADMMLLAARLRTDSAVAMTAASSTIIAPRSSNGDVVPPAAPKRHSDLAPATITALAAALGSHQHDDEFVVEECRSVVSASSHYQSEDEDREEEEGRSLHHRHQRHHHHNGTLSSPQPTWHEFTTTILGGDDDNDDSQHHHHHRRYGEYDDEFDSDSDASDLDWPAAQRPETPKLSLPRRGTSDGAAGLLQRSASTLSLFSFSVGSGTATPSQRPAVSGAATKSATPLSRQTLPRPQQQHHPTTPTPTTATAGRVSPATADALHECSIRAFAAVHDAHFDHVALPFPLPPPTLVPAPALMPPTPRRSMPRPLSVVIPPTTPDPGYMHPCPMVHHDPVTGALVSPKYVVDWKPVAKRKQRPASRRTSLATSPVLLDAGSGASLAASTLSPSTATGSRTSKVTSGGNGTHHRRKLSASSLASALSHLGQARGVSPAPGSTSSMTSSSKCAAAASIRRSGSDASSGSSTTVVATVSSPAKPTIPLVEYHRRKLRKPVAESNTSPFEDAAHGFEAGWDRFSRAARKMLHVGSPVANSSSASAPSASSPQPDEWVPQNATTVRARVDLPGTPVELLGLIMDRPQWDPNCTSMTTVYESDFHTTTQYDFQDTPPVQFVEATSVNGHSLVLSSMALPDISSAGSAAPAPPTTPTKSASTATSSGLATPTSVADVKSLIVGWVLDPVNLPKPGAPPMTSVSLYVHARVRDRRRPFRRSAPSRRAALEVAQWLEAVAGTAVVLASTSAAATTAGMAEGSNGPATLGRPASALAVPVLVARLLNGPGLETSGTLSAPSAMLHRTQSMSRACRTLTSHASGAEVVGGNGRIGSGSPLRIATAAMSSSSPLRPIRHARSASDTRISYIPRGPQPSPPTSTSRGDADAVVDEDVVRPRGQSTPVLLGQDLCGTESAAAAIGSATLEARARAAVVVSRQWSRWSWRSGGAGGMIDERAWVAESVRLLAGMMRAGWTAIAGRVSWRRAGTNQ